MSEGATKGITWTMGGLSGDANSTNQVCLKRVLYGGAHETKSENCKLRKVERDYRSRKGRARRDRKRYLKQT